MKLNELGRSSFVNANKKGFYNKINELMQHNDLTQEHKEFILYLWRSSRLMLIVSELSEGLEGLRKGNLSATPKSGGLGEELADTQIRLADFSEDLGLDLESAVAEKAKFNDKREHMHGGKAG